ncbi:MAG: EAL domain-containing protein [Rhodospirillaceae bacterium]
MCGGERLEERVPLAAKASFEGVWEWDLPVGTLTASQRFLVLVGLPASPLYQIDDWFSRVHPDDLPWLFACFEGQEGKTEPFYIEHRVSDGNCGWRWLACRGVAKLGEDGLPERIAGIVSDSSDAKAAEQRFKQSEERYALAAAAASDGLYDWDILTGKIEYSPRWKSILGFAAEDITDSPSEWLGRVLSDDLIWLQATLEEQVRPSGVPLPSFTIEYRIRDAGNAVRWMVCRGMAVRDDCGNAVRVIGSQSDITDRKLAEQQLRQSEERYALAARGANDGLWDWRLDTGETYFSPRCMSMLGQPEVALIDSPRRWLRCVMAEDRPGLLQALHSHLSGDTGHLAHEFRMRRADYTIAWCLTRGMAVRDGNDRPVRIAGSVTDITERKKAELRLQYNAFHDGLTGLPNRSLMLDRIGRAIARLQSGGKHFAVILLDLDRFKSVNDSLGTKTGDLVLTTTAVRLLRERRPSDTLARLSADEFAILFEDIEPGLVMAEALRATEAVKRPYILENHNIVFTASAGVALSVSGYDRAEDMLRDASLAMVRAKTAGRARIELFDVRLRDHALSRARTEAELRRALEENQFELYYQPIVELGGERIAGVEALIRWQHPERGLVPPIDFIPLAEETGLIVMIGRWALEQAAAQLVAWQATYPGYDKLFTCVNVATRQLRDDNMLTRVKEVLTATGISPASLKLEITESELMTEQNEAEPTMQAIQALGVRFSIDDFGTGYSSLSYLHRMPADTLKIDKSFVQAISEGREKAAIVELIVRLAGLLRMDVVAEGIETEQERQFLRSLGCKYGQGYYYARPMPADRLGILLERKKPLPVAEET